MQLIAYVSCVPNFPQCVHRGLSLPLAVKFCLELGDLSLHLVVKLCPELGVKIDLL